ncbi:MICOS complex subunit MIC10 [Taenia crassiceps]|uniref:MICOS complex subunit MIC10 n=1 Tax=Taenia crassiceps TaxID=6207 RepID=A0ABR4QTN3_9CEST
MGSPGNSEDIIGRKVDRCISDVLIKTALGRPWPLIFGTGFGLGMGISNCNSEFKQPLPLQSHVIKVKTSD